MTYRLTPREDRLRVLHAARDRIDAEIHRLQSAERDDPPVDLDRAALGRERTAKARRDLLRWAATPAFAARLARYGGSSVGAGRQDREKETA